MRARASRRAGSRCRPDVSFTAIYSKRDGIVDWRACVDPLAVPVEVTASHAGLAFDPRVIREVLAALDGPTASSPGSRTRHCSTS